MGAAAALGSMSEGLASAVATGLLVAGMTVAFVLMRSRYRRPPARDSAEVERSDQFQWRPDQFELIWLGLLGAGVVIFGIGLVYAGGLSRASAVLWPVVVILGAWIAVRYWFGRKGQ